VDVEALFQEVFDAKNGKTEDDFMDTVKSLEAWCVSACIACIHLPARAKAAHLIGRTDWQTRTQPPSHRLTPDVIDFLVAKISGFGKEREPALSLLCKMDPAFIRRKLPDILQPVINMCTDTSKKVRCVPPPSTC
jgi:hypothetical protein